MERSSSSGPLNPSPRSCALARPSPPTGPPPPSTPYLYTRDIRSLGSILKGMRGEAGTALYDAIFFAARDLEPREGRKVIIVVTDGGDTGIQRNLQAALEEAQLADAVIYPVVVVPITNE